MWVRLDKTIRPLWSPARILALAFTLGVLLGADVLLGAWTLHVSRQNCVQVRQVESTIEQAAMRNLKMLGRPGSNAYAYYLAHPNELVLAKRELRRDVQQFTPPQCSGPF